MSLLRQSALAAMSAIVLSGSRFAFTAILARRLSLENFGHFAYAQWLVDIAFLVCALGATGAVSRYAAEFRSDEIKLESFMRAWRRWALGLPLLGGIVVLIGAWMSGYEHDAWAKLMLSVWAASSGFMAMQMAALSGFQRFELIFRSNLIFAIIILLGSWLLPTNFMGPTALFALMAVASSVASLPGIIMIGRRKNVDAHQLSADQTRKIRNYALNMWLVALLWSLVWSRGELPVVRAHLGDAGVASYVAVLTLFGGAIQGVMLGVSAIAPELTRLWGSDRKEEALKLARSVMDMQLLVCGITLAMFICLGPELLTLLFGENYRIQANTLAILGFGLLAIAFSTQNHLLQIATDGRFSRDSSLAGLLALVALSLTLIPSFGLIGAALTRSCTMILLIGLTIIKYQNIQKEKFLNYHNLIIIFFINATCFGITLSNHIYGFFEHLSLLIVAIILIALLVRDDVGIIKSFSIFKILRKKIFQGFKQI